MWAADAAQDALVRQAALDALLDIYSAEENLSPLHGFTGRFQHRFAELVYDVDEAVAVKGVRLVTQLVQAEEMPQDEVRSPHVPRRASPPCDLTRKSRDSEAHCVLLGAVCERVRRCTAAFGSCAPSLVKLSREDICASMGCGADDRCIAVRCVGLMWRR